MVKKCICKRWKEGYINLRCPIHTILPKIDKKHLIKKGDKFNPIINLDKFFYAKTN